MRQPGTTLLLVRRTGHKLCVAAIFISLFSANIAQADDETNVAHGSFFLSGSLTESACNLEMSSAWQEVKLGNIDTGQLMSVGDQGTAVPISITLRNCVRGTASLRNERTGLALWSASQPMASLTFVAPADENASSLFKVKGVSGLALRLRDPGGRDVRPGSRGVPMFLSEGQNQLVYTVTPERTSAPLMAGGYQTQFDFKLNYD